MMNCLSDSCIEKLHWIVDEDEEFADDFIKNADRYVAWARMLSEHKKHNMADAQERINRVKKAFAKLTEQDREFLDLQVDMPVINTLGFKPSGACENMQRALDVPVPSVQFDLSRMALLTFACIAIREEWIDVSVNNINLTAVLKILIKEAGLKHDAVDIAGDASKDPSQAFPEGYLSLFYLHRWSEIPK